MSGPGTGFNRYFLPVLVGVALASTIAGFIVTVALGFLALAIAALTVALILGLR